MQHAIGNDKIQHAIGNDKILYIFNHFIWILEEFERERGKKERERDLYINI